MMIRHLTTPGALLLAVNAGAGAQSDPVPMQQVTVSAAAAGALEQRALSTTATIVVGHDELVRQGDDSLTEVLKRQPGISIDGAPGKPAIRMRGLGAGYVAILLNGTPAPSGFSLESIAPDLVERIEILRAPTAETTGQAVAGAINIVLRKGGKAGAPTTELKAGSALEAGHPSPTLNLQKSGRSGALGYTLAATAKRNDRSFAGVATEEGRQPALLRHTAWLDHQVGDTLELAPRLDWQASAQDSLASQSYVRWQRVGNDKRELEDVERGEATSFPHGLHRYDAHVAQAYADLAWTRKLPEGARLSAKLSGFVMKRDADFLYRGLDFGDTLLETHRVASGPSARELNFNGSYRRPLFGSHALALGWELGRKRRDEYRREHQADALGHPLLDSDEDYQATVRRSAFWIQDEWELGAAWSAYLGLRRESLHTVGEGKAHAAVDVDSGVWSPIFQALYKPGGAGKGGKQFRFALSRTYKAPDIVLLMPRRYTVDNDNSAINPDQQGNPNLRPELSLGTDLAWEHYMGKDDMLGIGGFSKRIRDVTLFRVFEQNGVWVSMPDNAGGARVHGLELEARSKRGALSGRANLTRTWSRLDAVAGPDNRIPDQPDWTANLGLDYAPAGRPLELGGSYSHRSGHASRQSPQLADFAGPKRQLDLYAVWKRGPSARLRLSVSDLLHRNYVDGNTYVRTGADVGAAAGDLAMTVVHRPRTVWRAVWKQNL